MLVIYEAAQDDFVLPNSDERAEKVMFSEIEPQINDLVCMGEKRSWEVIDIEHYRSDTGIACLAIVIPQGMPVPDKADWSGIYWPQYPNRTFAVAVQPDREVITYESHMDGIPMSGRIEKAVIVDGKAQLMQSDWIVHKIVTYKSTVPSAYATIYCCECAYSHLKAVAV